MKRPLQIVIFLLLISPGLGAEDSILFISSRPIGARVSINGRNCESPTPMIIRDLKPGKYRIEWLKDGHIPQKITIEINPDEKKAVSPVLEELSFLPRFAPGETLLINGIPVTGPQGDYRIPASTYAIYEDQNVLRMESRYPYSSLVKVLHGTIPAFITGTLLLGVNDYYHPQSSGHYFSAPVYSSLGITLGLAALDIGLSIQEKRYKERAASLLTPQNRTTPEELFSNAEAAFSRERFVEALEFYQEILLFHDESAYFIPALYKSGRLHQIKGETGLAKAKLDLIVERYPGPEYYDKACKTLADMAYGAGDGETAILYLDRMVCFDPLYTDDSIKNYREKIQETL